MNVVCTNSSFCILSILVKCEYLFLKQAVSSADAPKTGHGFLSLEDNTVVTYLLSSEYSQKDEFELSFLDESLGITLPGSGHILSEKDRTAPGISELRKLGTLPGLLGDA